MHKKHSQAILLYSVLNVIFTGLIIHIFNILQPQAREKAEKEGFEVGVVKTSFKANTKALAENEGEGLAKVMI